MKKKLSGWSKDIKKKMIDLDMDINDVAERMKWSRQFTSAIINGREYYKEPVARISCFFGIEEPLENSTLAIRKETNE